MELHLGNLHLVTAAILGLQGRKEKERHPTQGQKRKTKVVRACVKFALEWWFCADCFSHFQVLRFTSSIDTLLVSCQSTSLLNLTKEQKIEVRKLKTNAWKLFKTVYHSHSCLCTLRYTTLYSITFMTRFVYCVSLVFGWNLWINVISSPGPSPTIFLKGWLCIYSEGYSM